MITVPEESKLPSSLAGRTTTAAAGKTGAVVWTTEGPVVFIDDDAELLLYSTEDNRATESPTDVPTTEHKSKTVVLS